MRTPGRINLRVIPEIRVSQTKSPHNTNILWVHRDVPLLKLGNLPHHIWFNMTFSQSKSFIPSFFKAMGIFLLLYSKISDSLNSVSQNNIFHDVSKYTMNYSYFTVETKLKNDLNTDTVLLRVRWIFTILLFQKCDLAQTSTNKRRDGNNTETYILTESRGLTWVISRENFRDLFRIKLPI